MNDEFVNRLDAFTRSLDVLTLPEYLPIWKDKPPVMFTSKVDEAETMVATLREAQKDHEKGITGTTEEKDREETELELAASALSHALWLYYMDHQQETEAASFDMEISHWMELRDQQLLAKSQLVIDHASALAGSVDAIVVTAAEKYGITTAAVVSLTKERGDYDAIVNAPSVAISVRKALTRGFRPAFALVDKKFVEIEKLMPQFGTTDAGKAMISAWKGARRIKDLGHGPQEEEAPATSTPAPAAA
jgi:hypothetical protein